MAKSMKKTARQFIKEYNVTSPTIETLEAILERQGYTVVEFSSVYNDSEVADLITALKLKEQISSGKGFTYADSNNRIVFVNEDLSEKERLLVLLHEEGHIYCGHMEEASVIGRSVVQEYEANEFVHYVLESKTSSGFGQWIKTHKALSIVLCVLLVALIGGLTTFIIYRATHKTVKPYVTEDGTVYEEYYVTETGFKYHKKDCQYLKGKENVRPLTDEELNSGEYTPCERCLPSNKK